MTIVKTRLRCAGKGEDHMGHDVTSLDLRILEDGVTITVLTFIDIKLDELLLNGIIAEYSLDDILDLYSICAYVLDGGSAHLSRYI